MATLHTIPQDTPFTVDHHTTTSAELAISCASIQEAADRACRLATLPDFSGTVQIHGTEVRVQIRDVTGWLSAAMVDAFLMAVCHASTR